MVVSQRIEPDTVGIEEEQQRAGGGLDRRRVMAVIWALRGLGAVAFVVGIIAGIGMLAVGGVTGLPFAMALTVAGAAGGATLAFCAVNLELLMAIHERLGEQGYPDGLRPVSGRAVRPTAQG